MTRFSTIGTRAAVTEAYTKEAHSAGARESFDWKIADVRRLRERPRLWYPHMGMTDPTVNIPEVSRRCSSASSAP
jgi:hypothetical protein